MPALSLDSLRAFAIAVLSDDPRAVHAEITAILAEAHAPPPPTPSNLTIITFPSTDSHQATQTHVTIQQPTRAEQHRELGRALHRLDRFLPNLERAKKVYDLVAYIRNSRARYRIRQSFVYKRLVQTARLHCLVQLMANELVFTLDLLTGDDQREAHASVYLHATPAPTKTKEHRSPIQWPLP